jgi:hypothetical protein
VAGSTSTYMLQKVLKSLEPRDEFEVDDDWRPGPFYFSKH